MRLLIIGTDHNEIAQASVIAKKNGADVTHIQTIDNAVSQICSGNSADLIMVDVNLDIAKLIDALGKERITIPIIGFGLNANSEKAVAAIKAGAREYIPLPPDEALIAAVLEMIADDQHDVIANSDAMKQILAMAERVAPSDANILITGESGTGKEVVAKYIHQHSKRSKQSFISVNCAAIPDNLLESELFGHEKGAFTGAAHTRIGKFEESNNGTLLLDEISEMDLRLQAKLLRAIQEKEIDRVGGTKPIKLNLRIIATSNRDLKKHVEDGHFREDLFFRLNVINLDLPPLRTRKQDIPAFIEHFVKKFANDNGVPALPVNNGTMEKLKAHAWPGNVRELENSVHRAVLLATGDEITDDAFQFDGTQHASNDSDAGDMVGRSLESVEQELIIKTLDHCDGNRTHAANILGISIRTLRNKLNQYNEEESAAEA